jgi:hypothetical protein
MRRPTGLFVLAILFLSLGLVVANLSSVSASPARRQAGPCPPGVPAITTQPVTPTDVIKYVETHPLPRNINANAVIDATTVRYQFNITLETAKAYLGGDDNGCPGSTAIAYVEFQAAASSSLTSTPPPVSPAPRPNFEFPGPDGAVSYPVGFEVFAVATGNLLVSGGRLQPEPNLTPVSQ